MEVTPEEDSGELTPEELELVERWRRLLLGGEAERVEERGGALEDERERGDSDRSPSGTGHPAA